jgi:hypothetical protein
MMSPVCPFLVFHSSRKARTGSIEAAVRAGGVNHAIVTMTVGGVHVAKLGKRAANLFMVKLD